MAVAVAQLIIRQNGVNVAGMTVLEGELGKFNNTTDAPAFVATDEFNVLCSTTDALTSGSIGWSHVGMMIALPTTKLKDPIGRGVVARPR